jgi:hypothetical protein
MPTSHPQYPLIVKFRHQQAQTFLDNLLSKLQMPFLALWSYYSLYDFI